MNKTVWIMIGSLLVLGALGYWYVNLNTDQQEVGSGEEPAVIGFLLPNQRSERWQREAKLVPEAAAKVGAYVNVLEANDSADVQLTQAESLIAQGVDILIVVAVDSVKAAQIVEKAHAAGIKVIAYDRLIRDSDLDFYVSFDSIEVGKIQASTVLPAMTGPNLAYVGGSPTDNNAHLLKQGSLSVLQPKIDAGQIKVVFDQFTDGWKAEVAYQNLKTFMDKNPTVRLDGIIAGSDSPALGVFQLLKEKGLAGKVPLVSQDASLAACQRVAEGTQLMTVYKPLHQLATKAVEAALDLVEKGTAVSNSKTDNGRISVNTYLLGVIPVTKNNLMDTVIKDKFHTYEQVYQNVPASQRPPLK